MSTKLIRMYRRDIARSFTEQCYLNIEHVNKRQHLSELSKQASSTEKVQGWNLEDTARSNAFGDNEDYPSNAKDIEGVPDIKARSVTSFLVSNTAFLKFLEDFKEEIYYNTGGVMQIIKKTVLNNSKDSPTIYASFENLGREIIQYLHEQYEDGQSLAQMLIVVGTASQAYSGPCLKYMQDTWPKSGQATLEFLYTALRANRHDFQHSVSPDTSIHYSSHSMHSDHDPFLTVTIRASPHDVAEIAQQLSFLSAYFRPPRTSVLCQSEISIIDLRNGRFRLDLLDLQPIPDVQSSCWHPLFAGSIIARGFPTPSRSGQVGIEIPYSLMISLARVQYPVEYKGAILLKGFSTMLIPTSFNPDSVQWHFMSSSGNRRLPTASVKDRLECCLQIEDLNNISEKRTFLGFSWKVNVLLGTRNADYDHVGYSTHAKPIGMKLSLDGITAGFTAAAHGIPGPTVNANLKLSKNQAMIRDRDQGDFAGTLEELKVRPVILYDVDVKKSWLVSAIGVVLHMVHIFARKRPRLFQYGNQAVEPPFAEVSWDGGQAALDAMGNNALLALHLRSGTDAHPFRLMDLVGQLWGNLESAFESLENQKPTGYPFELSRTVRGWELMDMAFPQYPRPKQSRIDRSGGGWHQLTNDVMTLFCSGLGDLIKTDGPQQVCPGWLAVPPDKDYMVASVSSLMLLSATCGKAKDGHFRLTNEFCLHRSSLEIFGSCSHSPNERCDLLQEISAFQKSCLPPSRMDINIHHAANCGFPKEGAVIIGKKTRLIKKKREDTSDTRKRKVNRREACENEHDPQPNATNGVYDHLNLNESGVEGLNVGADEANVNSTVNQETTTLGI